MKAVKQTLSHFDLPPRSHILVASDNTTVMAYINKVGGTRSWSLWKETESLFSLATSGSLSVRARYIPGKMNVIADDLSKVGQILPTGQSHIPTMGIPQSRPLCHEIQHKVCNLLCPQHQTAELLTQML